MSFFRKFTKLALGASVLVAAFSMATGTAMAQCSACVNSVTLPSGNVTFSALNLNRGFSTDDALATGNGLFSVTLSNVTAGTALSNKSYTGWCAAWFGSSVQTDGTTGAPVYSSYAANFPPAANPIVPNDTFNMVNWILNNKTGTVQDVQNAIWLVITGVTDPLYPPSKTATDLAAAAKGNPNYIPNAFGVMAVLYQFGPALDATQTNTGSELQTVMIEIPVPMVGTVNTCDSCVTNLKVPATVHYTVTQNDDDYWCSKVSNTTSSITVTGVPSGYNVSNKSYSVWNAGWWTSNVVTGRHGFPAYSTYDAANYPAGLKPIVAGNTINMVNYILNNKQGTPTDIQNAIYKIMVGSTPAPLTAAGTAMVTAALANANYCPPANGTIVAVIAANTTIAANATIADPQNMPLFIELVCAAPAPAGTPSLSLKKTAGVAKVNPFQKVTYTYVVTNTGTVTLTNILVVDDNATPGNTKDDFTVGTVASLAPGAFATLTASVYPPVTENAQQDGSDWGGFGNYGGHNWNDDGSNSVSGGTLICKETPEGNLNITYRQSTSLSDNTYGHGSSSDWGYMGHSFQNFVNGTDGAQFQILDKSGNVVLDFVADYISPSSKTRSGYGSLGVKGGGGMVFKGNPAHVLRCDSSLSRNLNRQTKYNKCTSDSPNASDWDNEQSYTVEIDKASCANGGFGGVKLPKIENDHSKQQGDEKHVVHPVTSVATNTATASATFFGTTVSATAKASVTIDASSSGWSQCSKY